MCKTRKIALTSILFTLIILSSTQLTTAQTITTVTGSDNKETGYFHIPTTDCIINWEYTTESPDYALFSVFIDPKDWANGYENFKAEGGTYIDEETATNSGSQYIPLGNGDYKLKILAANLESYTVTVLLGETYATPSPNPTPTPTQKPTTAPTIKPIEPSQTEQGWQTLHTITGAASQTTQTYQISSSEWRIRWSYNPHATYPAYSSFNFFVYPETTTTQYTTMVNVMGTDQLSGTEYIHTGHGAYYLKIGAANIPSYTITIEQKISPQQTSESPPATDSPNYAIGIAISTILFIAAGATAIYVLQKRAYKKER